ncbi:MAG: hypothetical protein IPP48_13415 [Chitinophagaceae bacterium]|nr:hypothetical protein [Chitinophagaceae bacterium]
MAILTGALSFTGSLQGLSAYKMRGTNKIILRRKGGATKERIQKHPSFEIVRRNNEEWKACIKAVAGIRQIMHPVRHLADYNFSATLNGLCKRIQAADKMNAFGFRSVLLSQAGYALQGFQLNKQNNFDNLLQHPLSCTLNRDTATATILLPQLMPNINFFTPNNYRFTGLYLYWALQWIWCIMPPKQLPTGTYA